MNTSTRKFGGLMAATILVWQTQIPVFADQTKGMTPRQYSTLTTTPAATVLIPLGYKDTARFKPQVIMAGVSPSVIDAGDTEFDILALVRPGVLEMQSVTLGQGANAWFNKSMKHINTLPNGDQFWKVTFAFDRGAFGFNDIPIKWGGGANEFFIRATDKNQQSFAAQQFPLISVANAPAQVATLDTSHTDELSFNATKRVQPQIIMAGVSPAIVDILDTAFDIVTIVRPGVLPIKNVVLKQGGNIFFNIAMEKRYQLKNGDQIWGAEFAFPQGSFGITTIPIVWGNGQNEFTIQVTDTAQQVAANYPSLKAGVFPAQ